MSEQLEPAHGPFEHLKMEGPRGSVEKFIIGKSLVRVSLENHPDKEKTILDGEGYTHWRDLKAHRGNVILGDEVTFEQFRELYESQINERESGEDEKPLPFTAIILARDFDGDELETGIYKGKWSLLVMSRPRN